MSNMFSYELAELYWSGVLPVLLFVLFLGSLFVMVVVLPLLDYCKVRNQILLVVSLFALMIVIFSIIMEVAVGSSDREEPLGS